MSRANKFILAAGILMFLAVTLISIYRIYGPKIVITQDVKREADIRALGNALQEYQHISGSFPTQEQGLAVLVTKPTASPIPQAWYQMMSRLPLDPWNQPYVYRIPARRSHQPYDLFSTGADKVESQDDIGNWSGEK